jgi:hypothetical protein
VALDFLDEALEVEVVDPTQHRLHHEAAQMSARFFMSGLPIRSFVPALHDEVPVPRVAVERTDLLAIRVCDPRRTPPRASSSGAILPTPGSPRRTSALLCEPCAPSRSAPIRALGVTAYESQTRLGRD